MLSIAFTDLPTNLQQISSPKFLTKGEILLQQGDVARSIYLVISGQIRLVSFVNQQMVTHYFVNAGEMLGESALYVPNYACTAIAETHSEIILIPVEDFADALKTNPDLAERYLAHLTQRFYAVKSLLELRSIHSSRDRLMRYLIPRLAPGQYTITLDKPLQAVASELALTPEALSRLLSRLEAEGAIARQRRVITFSPEWLEDVAEY
ncbi:MAG: Crp/Fnr family transcriptional regulator [Cyanobacteria bacterium P01_F01_bin.86]